MPGHYRVQLTAIIVMVFLNGMQGTVRADDAPQVSPTDEIEILDPRVDSEGEPRAMVTEGPNGPQIDIPPTVIVHKYYYTGKRNFQGPVFPGGPSIVVASHPRSGTRLYIDVTLLPGSPRVYYRHDAIVYDFGEESIAIVFPLIGKPRVIRCDGLPWPEKTEAAAGSVVKAVGAVAYETRIPSATKDVAIGAWDAVSTAAMRIHDVGERVAAPAIVVFRALPISRLLTASPEERAAAKRDREVRRAARSLNQADESIRTLR